MKTIKWICETGFVKSTHEGEFEVDDDTTEEEINEMVLDEIFNRIEWSWNYE